MKLYIVYPGGAIYKESNIVGLETVKAVITNWRRSSGVFDKTIGFDITNQHFTRGCGHIDNTLGHNKDLHGRYECRCAYIPPMDLYI